STGIARNRASARLLVFKLGGTATLPPLPDAEPVPNPPPLRASEESVQRGARIYAQTCAQCHGQLAVGGVTDLRFMSPETHAASNRTGIAGTLAGRGMGSLAPMLPEQDVEDVPWYLIARANEDWGQSLRSRPEAARRVSRPVLCARAVAGRPSQRFSAESSVI